MKRALGVALGLLLALAVGVVLVLALTGPRLAERAIAWGGTALGYQDLRATVSALGPRSLEIERLSAGPAPGFTLEGISLRFAPRTLLAGRADLVSVRSAVLHGVWGEQGIEFPSLPAGEEDGPLIAPPAFARLELAQARVELAGESGPLAVTFTDTVIDAPPGARLHARTRAAVERAAGPLVAELELFLDGERVNGSVQVQDGAGALELRVDLGEPGPAPGRFPDVAGVEALVVAGRLALRAERADLSPLAPALSASADAGFELAEGLLALHAEQLEAFGVRVAGLETEIALAEVRAHTIKVASVEIEGSWDEQGITFPAFAEAAALARPTAAGAPPHASEPEAAQEPWLAPLPFDRVELARVRISLGGSRGPVALVLSDAQIDAPPGARWHARTRVDVERKPGALAGELDLVLDGERVSGRAQLRSADGDLDLRLDLGEPGPEPGRFPELAAVESLVAAGRLSLRAKRADLSPFVPALTVSADSAFELADGLLGLRAERLEAFGVRVAGVETQIALAEARARTVKVASVELEGTWDEQGISFPALAEAAGAAQPAAAAAEEEEPGPGLASLPFDRLDLGRARVALGGSRGPVALVLSDARIDTPPGARWHARTRVDVERKPDALAGEIDAVLDGPRLTGDANLRSGDGSIDLSLDLGKPGPAPGRFPELASLDALELSGRLEFAAQEADLSPLAEELTAKGGLDLRLSGGHLRMVSEGIALASGGFEVGGLGLSVELAGLASPTAPLGQRVSIQTLRAGLDLGGGTLRFGLRPGGVVQIDPLDWQLFGGRLYSVGSLDPSAERNELVVRVENVDLASLVAALGRADLAATGRVSGELPLRLEGDRIFADGGRLSASEEGGVIRYGLPSEPGAAEPAPGAQGGISLVLDALENFQYRTLEIGMDGEITGDLKLAVRLEGANPEVYDGYPFQVNLNLEGPLADVVKGSTIGFRVQDAVEERLQERGEKR